MKGECAMRYLSCVLATCLLCAGFALAAPLGSDFTYQGQLTDNGSPASGHYDLQFALFASASGGTAVDTITVANQSVSGGLINASLDFTDAPYNGQALWVEVNVRATGGPSYTTLAPRQAITATPYALYALSGTIGQPAATTLAASSYSLYDGFWAPASALSDLIFANGFDT